MNSMIHFTNEDPDFWIQLKGKNAGKPQGLLLKRCRIKDQLIVLWLVVTRCSGFFPWPRVYF
ncbi:MAG: hypothetical protein PHE46_11370, partial [Bacteroidales bacterium]|nr:hypothetical protein [Bacteroidales bacterium]